jgi:predicted O-linked N-acetylglucosamine transferase (SPINDLY family)
MREKLLRNHDTCPLFDMARFTRHIEADYAATWGAHGDGRAPAALAVEA